MAGLKEKIQEIVGLVELVPDQFKAQCFEMLLKDALDGNRDNGERSSKGQRARVNDGEQKLDEDADQTDNGAIDKSGSSTDITTNDLHMKVKRFMERNDVSIDRINELFYKEGGEFKPLIEDFGATTMAEATIRIALFQAFANSLATGEFQTTVESVREECKARKTYDRANWTNIFGRRASTFDFGTFSRDVSDLRLSEDGKRELAAFIKSVK